MAIYNPPAREPGETFDAYETRLQTAYADYETPAPKHVRDMSEAERETAWRELSRDKPRVAVPVHAGLHYRDMSPLQRQQAAAALGIAHLMSNGGNSRWYRDHS